MDRIKHTETRTVDGVEYRIDTIETLGYDGIWTLSGFDATVNGTTHKFFGWPTDSDLRRLTMRHGIKYGC